MGKLFRVWSLQTFVVAILYITARAAGTFHVIPAGRTALAIKWLIRYFGTGMAREPVAACAAT